MNIDVTMAAMATFTATVVVGVFSDLHKRKSERWRPRTRNLERGGILTLKGSNRCLGQEFSRIMMTRRKKERKEERKVLCVPDLPRFCRRRKCYRLCRRGFRRSVTGALPGTILNSWKEGTRHTSLSSVR